MQYDLTGFLITLKTVNSGIYVYCSREREPLFDRRCGFGILYAEQFC